MSKVFAIATNSLRVGFTAAALFTMMAAAVQPSVAQDAAENTDPPATAETESDPGPQSTSAVEETTSADTAAKDGASESPSSSSENGENAKPPQQDENADRAEKAKQPETTKEADKAKPADKASEDQSSTVFPSADAEGTPTTEYLVAVAVDGDHSYAIDLDLPGVWKISGDQTELFFHGSPLLRQYMNRPRPIAIHPEGGILVGDSATREIYHIDAEGKTATAIGGGYLGIPMAIAVSPDKKFIYVGDAERRALFRLPIGGGEFELVARVNARGLGFADDKTLYAATPDADAVVKVETDSKRVTPVVTDRPYQYVNGLVFDGDEGFVSDGYAKTIWRFTPDGKTEPWFEGDPLTGPVALAIDDAAVYVADPRSNTVWRIDRESKKPTKALMPPSE